MFQEISTALGFHPPLKMIPNSSWLSPLSLPLPHLPPQLIPPLLSLPAPSPPMKSILFPPLRKIHVCPLEQSSLPSVSVSTDCSWVIIYLMANIHL